MLLAVLTICFDISATFKLEILYVWARISLMLVGFHLAYNLATGGGIAKWILYVYLMDDLYHVLLYVRYSLSFWSACKFAHWHWTHTVNEFGGVRKWLLCIFCRECVSDAISSLDYLNFPCSMSSFMCYTFPHNFRWSKGYIYNSSFYHHQIESINIFHCCHIFRVCMPEVVVS